MSILHSIFYHIIEKGKTEYDPMNPPDYAKKRIQEEKQAAMAPAPAGVIFQKKKIDSVETEFVSWKSNPTDIIIYYIHGGGFVAGSSRQRRNFTGYVAKKMGFNVISVDYRLAPETPFPGGAEDCLKVYRKLLEDYAPEKIAFMGESAGGNLVLATALMAKDQNLPLPGCIITASPTVQYSRELPSYKMNADTDCMITNLSEEVKDVYFQSKDRTVFENPYGAPLYGDFHGFPPVFINVSKSEALKDDAYLLNEKLQDQGVITKLLERENVMHAYLIQAMLPEARRDLKEVRTFLVNTIMKKKKDGRPMRSKFSPFLPLGEYIADGEPHVFDDRVYLYGSHDEAGGSTYCARDYEFYSAPVDDITNWSSKGTSYCAKQDKNWSVERPYMFAPDCVKGNDGRYYLYYAMAGKNGDGGYKGPIEAAVADRPDGPFEFYGTVRDRNGNPWLNYVPFDPAVINDDGTIRLYYGAGYGFANYKSFLFRKMMNRMEAGIYGKTEQEIEECPGGINGAVHVELSEDMLTVISEPVKITPDVTKGTMWEKHPFFEASSIRKIKDTYYFIYSSQKGHELCYATSKHPDREFVYRGVIISNGDVGYKGRKEKDRIAATGNNHGSIACIKGQWYVFYHRQTNGTNFSRQACAEPIEILADGSIPQVSVSSCGLHGGSIKPDGWYPAAMACIISNGHMKVVGNPFGRNDPKITEQNGNTFITNIQRKTVIGIRKFDFSGNCYQLKMDYRCSSDAGYWKVYADESLEKLLGVVRKPMCEITVQPDKGSHTLIFQYCGKGKADFIEFYLKEQTKKKLSKEK